MFLKIEAHQYHRYAGLIDQFLQLRKRVFADDLGWDVEVANDRERDAYDDCSPVYLFWTNDDATKVYAGLRLMPTTGPTLLHDVFSATFGDQVDLIGASIWEATRLCFDADLLKAEQPAVAPMRAMMLMIAFAHEVAADAGITTLVSNYEPHHARVYNRAGVHFEEIGRADGYGRRPVCCGLFHVSKAGLAEIYATLGISRLQTRPAIRSVAEALAPVRPAELERLAA